MDKPKASTPAAAASALVGRRDHSAESGQEGALVQERMVAMQILPSGHGAAAGGGDSSLSPPPAAPSVKSLDFHCFQIVDEIFNLHVMIDASLQAEQQYCWYATGG